MKNKQSFEVEKKISKNDLLKAATQGVISIAQAEKLWETLSVGKLSKMLLVIYYFGALLIISAMTWCMTLGWSWFGGGGLFLISLCYGVLCFTTGYLLWQKRAFKISGGLLVTVAVCMTPLAIFGLEKWLGIWPAGDPGDYTGYYTWVKGSWLCMEVGTILAGLLALKWVRFPFITAPIALSIWLLSLDSTPLLFGELSFTWQQKCWVSLCFGVALLVCSYCIDKKSKGDFAFWSYLFGTLAFWGGLSLLAWSSELSWLLYFFINMALIASSLFLRRNVLMIFGALGVVNFLTHLAYQVFKDLIIFPFALSFIGLMTLFLGILYQKNSCRIKEIIQKLFVCNNSK